MTTNIRHLFTARSARPRVEATVKALVQTAVTLASADGRVEEREIESLVDGLRAVMIKTVGEEHVDEYAKVSLLLDEARSAVRHLASAGEPMLIAEIADALEGEFKQDALMVASAVVWADGIVTEAERATLARLAAALEIGADEMLPKQPA